MLRRIYEPRAYGPDPVAECYWTTTVVAPEPDPQAEGDLRCEIAVIGAGYTGMNAALTLASAGVDVILLDAETPGWGASGRNGGFCCDGGSKLTSAEIRARYGAADEALWRGAQRAAIDHVGELLETFGIDADCHSKGETMLAHRPREAAAFAAQAKAFEAAFGLKAEVLGRDALAERGLAGPEFHGALTTPLGFALNPLKYATGLAAAARAAGVRVFAKSPVTGLDGAGNGWRLQTPRAQITATKIVIATNGYSSENLPGWMAGRYLPAQSSVIVTRPLSLDEMQAQGFTSRQMCADTRRLLHYFRLMPDNRFLFGMRGAVRADGRSQQATRTRIRHNFDTMFPAWAGVETEHFWSGFVCLTARRTPFVGALDRQDNAFAAFAYHGNGVAMGSYCGRLVADMAMARDGGRQAPGFLSLPPRHFPLGRWRRGLLLLAYGWYQMRDR